MGWLGRLLGERGDAALPLYNAVVTSARQEHWYVAGAVPDTVDGRFDMIAAVLSMVLLRLEGEETARALSAQLTERFVDDMDGQLRQMGIGDITVGKHMGRMMSMLGGRLGAYRDGMAGGTFDAALVRNLYRGADPGVDAVAHVGRALTAFRTALGERPLTTITAGELP